VYLGLDLPDFGECDTAFPGGVSCLRVGDAIILTAAFQPGVAWFFAIPYPAEEGLKGEFNADGDVLQDL